MVEPPKAQILTMFPFMLHRGQESRDRLVKS